MPRGAARAPGSSTGASPSRCPGSSDAPWAHALEEAPRPQAPTTPTTPTAVFRGARRSLLETCRLPGARAQEPGVSFLGWEGEVALAGWSWEPVSA